MNVTTISEVGIDTYGNVLVEARNAVIVYVLCACVCDCFVCFKTLAHTALFNFINNNAIDTLVCRSICFVLIYFPNSQWRAHNGNSIIVNCGVRLLFSWFDIITFAYNLVLIETFWSTIVNSCAVCTVQVHLQRK